MTVSSHADFLGAMRGRDVRGRIRSDGYWEQRINIPGKKESSDAEREAPCSRGDRGAEMVVFTIFRNTARPPDTIAASARHSF